MKTRLLGTLLVTAWCLSIPGAAWAQGRGGGHRGGANGGGRSSGGHGQAQPRDRSRIAVIPRVGPIGGSRLIFSQPYYAFQPRHHLGLGFYLGYPVAYPAARFYSNAYLYAYPYGYYQYPLPSYSTVIPTYGYASATPTYPYSSPTPTFPNFNAAPQVPAGGVITVAPGGPNVPATGGAQPPAVTGGVSFEITPADAAVFVDGVYVGTANDFSPTAPPLLLAAGRHRFELRAQGYQTVALDVDVTADLVLPYRGAMQP